MDAERIEKIRSPGFDSAVLGYNRAQVDKFLAIVADWLEGSGEGDERSIALQSEVSRINEQTAGVLSAATAAAAEVRREADGKAAAVREEADKEAERVRSEADAYDSKTKGDADAYAKSARTEADAYAEATRNEADGYSESTRNEADGYAASTRGAADSYGGERRTEAEGEAETIVAGARTKADLLLAAGREERTDLEAEIEGLKRQREQLLDELENLASSLTGTATLHRDTQAMDIVDDPDAEDERDPGLEAETQVEPVGAPPAYVEENAAEHAIERFDPFDEDGLGDLGAAEAETNTMPLPERPDDPGDGPTR